MFHQKLSHINPFLVAIAAVDVDAGVAKVVAVGAQIVFAAFSRKTGCGEFPDVHVRRSCVVTRLLA